MSKTILEKDMNDSNYGNDKFSGDSIVLIQLNSLPKGSEIGNLVTSIDCIIKENYVIKERKEVFESIYSTGKKVYKYLTKNYTCDDLNDLLHSAMLDKEKTDFLKRTFNEFVQDNGYPYLIEKLPHIDNNIVVPNYLEFIDECITTYTIEELRRWIIKIRKEEVPFEDSYSPSENVISKTNKAKQTFDLLKNELISSLINNECYVVYDDISENEVIELLQDGFPVADKSPLKKGKLLKFLTILQRTLMAYIIGTTNKKNKNQYIVNKRLPIFNSTSNQYRLYLIANSLMGISYDYLLSGLTVSKISFERAICNYPDCNNEFEKIGTGKYCEIHQDDEFKRKHIKHMSYLRSKEKNHNKKEATEK